MVHSMAIWNDIWAISNDILELQEGNTIVAFQFLKKKGRVII